MSSFIKVCIFLIALPLTGESLFLNRPDLQEWVDSQNEVVIILNDQYGPFSFRNSEGELQGLDVDVLRYLEKMTGLSIRLEGGDWGDIYRKTMTHQVDGALHVEVFDSSLDRLIFTHSYAHYPVAFIVNSSDSPFYHFYYLSGKKVAVERGGPYEDYLQREYPDIQLVSVSSIPEMLKELANHRVSAAFGLYQSLEFERTRSMLPGMTEVMIHQNSRLGYSRIAVNSEKPQLQEVLNLAIESMDTAKSLEIQKSWQSGSYHMRSIEQGNLFELSEEDRDWLTGQGDYNLAMMINDDYYPYFYKEDGVLKGAVPSLLDRFSQSLGMDVNLIIEENTSTLMESFIRKEVPGILQAPPVKGLSSWTEITEPLWSLKLVMAVKKGKHDEAPILMQGRCIAVTLPGIQTSLKEQGFPGNLIYYEEGIEKALMDLSREHIDAVLDDTNVLQHYLAEYNNLELVDAPGIVVPMQISTHWEQEPFIAIFNKYLRSLTEQERLAFLDLPTTEKSIDWAIMLKWGLLALGLVMILLVWIFYLKREIERRKTAEDRFRELADLSYEGLVFHQRGKIVDTNQQLLDLFHCEREDVLGKSILDLLHPDEHPRIMERHRQDQMWHFDTLARRLDGESFAVEIQSRILHRPQGSMQVSSFRDISVRKKREEELEQSRKELERISRTDGLTSLYNRRHFNRVMSDSLNLAKRSGQCLTLAIMDIDFFKSYNDHYGHLEGDNALIKVSKAVQELYRRSSDHVFRLGGEEFALLIIGDLENDSPEEIGERIRSKVESLKIPHEKNRVSDVITLSIGVVSLPVSKELKDTDLYRMADLALYEAKEGGRNRVAISSIDSSQSSLLI